MLAKWMAEYDKHLPLAQKKWEASLQQHKENKYVCDIFYQNLPGAAHCYAMKCSLLLISAKLPTTAS